ncbi:glycosyltransferase family 39 protein, partial [Candidatus Roizmanbacteria bacterium]|nr:glycosyltransferase family 39 protein [Candidatus Roizmanbacteria bacterium]
MFTKRLKPILSFLPLLIIIIAGFLFRLKGIQDNHSFWADEGYISSFARDIVMGKLSIAQGVYKVWYQPLQILTTSIFFFIFGISEFSARLPSVIIGSVGIVFAYFVAQKLSSTWGGLLAAFAYGFSQLNLANATQAKPYTIITVLFFMNIYLYLLLTESNNSQDHKVLFHIAIIILSTLATLFH